MRDQEMATRAGVSPHTVRYDHKHQGVAFDGMKRNFAR